MKTTFSITLLLFISFCGFSQCADADKLKFGGYYGGSSYKASEMAFKYFSFDVDTTQYCCDIRKIKSHADFILDKSRNHIVNRANLEFFNKLKFRDIMVVYHDYKNLDNYFDIYLDLDKCGKITYWITYEYNYSDSIKYGFGLEFDKLGNLISSEKFPDFSKNIDPEKLTEVCDAIEKVRNHESFDNKIIASVELNYLDESNTFCWLIKEEYEVYKNQEIDFEKWYQYSEKYFYINANTNEIEKILDRQRKVIYCGSAATFTKKKDKK